MDIREWRICEQKILLRHQLSISSKMRILWIGNFTNHWNIDHFLQKTSRILHKVEMHIFYNFPFFFLSRKKTFKNLFISHYLREVGKRWAELATNMKENNEGSFLASWIMSCLWWEHDEDDHLLAFFDTNLW